MAIKYDTVRAEELSATTDRVLGKLTRNSDISIKEQLLAILLQGGKEGSARANDLLRISAELEVSLPEPWLSRQQDVLSADADLIAKQQASAAESRKAGAEKRRLRKEQEARDAHERAEFERWKRSQNVSSRNRRPGEEDRLV